MSNAEYKYKIRTNAKGQEEIYDYWRKKFIALTPEEWVRQQFLSFLVEERGYPRSLISVEKAIVVNHMLKRYDAVVYDRKGKPVMLIEFKSAKVMLSQKTMEQAARYNLDLKVRYLLISNGVQHYCCRLDHEAKSYSFLSVIPRYEELGDCL